MQQWVKGSFHGKVPSGSSGNFPERVETRREMTLSPTADGRRRSRRLRRWLWAAAALWIIGAASETQARLLDIGGSLNISYGGSKTYSETDAGAFKSSINTIGQQYGIGIFGDAYRLGSYRADV